MVRSRPGKVGWSNLDYIINYLGQVIVSELSSLNRVKCLPYKHSSIFMSCLVQQLLKSTFNDLYFIGHMAVWAGATGKTSPAEYRCRQYLMPTIRKRYSSWIFMSGCTFGIPGLAVQWWLAAATAKKHHDEQLKYLWTTRLHFWR